MHDQTAIALYYQRQGGLKNILNTEAGLEPGSSTAIVPSRKALEMQRIARGMLCYSHLRQLEIISPISNTSTNDQLTCNDFCSECFTAKRSLQDSQTLDLKVIEKRHGVCHRRISWVCQVTSART